MKKPNIAIDGFSSTGKSSISKEISKRLGLIHLDTGALYRGITYFALQYCFDQNNIQIEKLIQELPNIHFSFDIKENEVLFLLNGQNISQEIRSIEVSQYVSIVAKIPEVRDFLLETQRNIALQGGIVMDGRDIGTIVLPDADYKFFMTASPDERAKRRYLELTAQGVSTNIDDIKKNLLERDKIDSEREIAPLIPAPDAIIIDNTLMDKEQSIQKILDYIKF